MRLVFDWGDLGFMVSRSFAELEKARVVLDRMRSGEDARRFFSHLVVASDLAARVLVEAWDPECRELFLSKFFFEQNGLSPKLFELYYYWKSLLSKEFSVGEGVVFVSGFKDDFFLSRGELSFFVETLARELEKVRRRV